jgi:hypothetical protein
VLTMVNKPQYDDFKPVGVEKATRRGNEVSWMLFLCPMPECGINVRVPNTDLRQKSSRCYKHMVDCKHAVDDPRIVKKRKPHASTTQPDAKSHRVDQHHQPRAADPAPTERLETTDLLKSKEEECSSLANRIKTIENDMKTMKRREEHQQEWIRHVCLHFGLPVSPIVSESQHVIDIIESRNAHNTKLGTVAKEVKSMLLKTHPDKSTSDTFTSVEVTQMLNRILELVT